MIGVTPFIALAALTGSLVNPTHPASIDSMPRREEP
jgi:hypothetical protein